MFSLVGCEIVTLRPLIAPPPSSRAHLGEQVDRGDGFGVMLCLSSSSSSSPPSGSQLEAVDYFVTNRRLVGAERGNFAAAHLANQCSLLCRGPPAPLRLGAPSR
jgi:hypothetical protein